ncbi:MAG: Forkhead-associated protein [Nocardioides sp.]|nr:Forkhead-associated protein [Nocardioides sp.]
MSDEAGRSLRSYRPGDWFGVFGARATVILPPTEKARVAALWEIVDDGASFDEALDALIAAGLRELPGFVLVSEDDDETKIVLRGAARATFTAEGEEVELEGSSATTWVERSLRGVTRMVIEVDEQGEGADFTIGGGLVRISRLDQPPYSSTAASEPAAEPAMLPADDYAGGDDAPADEVSSMVEQTADEEPAAELEPAPEAAPALPDGTGVAVDAGLPTEALAVQDLPDAVAPASDHDGATRSGEWNPGEFARQQPGIPGQPQAPSITSRPVARLSFSSGEIIEVDRAVLVGRAPEARRFTSTEQPRLVTVPSPNQEISSTHLEIRPGSGADHGSAVVTDMGSTNGTVLVQPGLPAEDLQPGIAVQLIPGAIIDLGDGVTIQVTNP